MVVSQKEMQKEFPVERQIPSGGELVEMCKSLREISRKGTTESWEVKTDLIFNSDGTTTTFMRSSAVNKKQKSS